jgi:glycosyltransferase involved in cell wall biosynthesis
MRLLFIVTEDWAFLRHRLPMARAALDMGLKVAVVTRASEHADEIRAQGIEVFDLAVERAGLSPLKDLKYLWGLICILRRFRPNVIHSVAAKPVLYGTLAAHLAARGAAVINAFTGLGILFTGNRNGQRSLKSRLLGRALTTGLGVLCRSRRIHILVQNTDDREFLLAQGIGHADRMHLIPGSGVDTNQFSPMPEPPAPPVRAVLVGRLLTSKGVIEFAEAARILKKRGQAIRMVLVGAPDPGNPTTVTKAQLDAWVEEQIIDWSGETDDIAGVWAAAHIAVLPSYREGLPKSLLEAAACARPLVATDVPGCRALVRDGGNGILVPVGDAGALADAIAALAGDPAKRLDMGQAARRDVEKTFAASRIAKQISDLYRSVTAGPNLSPLNGPA